MLFLDFKQKMSELGCFSVNQIFNWQPDFNINNLTRWAKKGYIFKLRNGYYALSDFLDIAGAHLYIANRIYRPSYISLHYVLNYYGMIPESVIDVTSVSCLKTATFSNIVGTFSYQRVQPSLFFGYEEKPFRNTVIKIATVEKAILDLLYLYPFYDSEKELELLRFDITAVKNDMKKKTLFTYLKNYKNKSLEKRVNLFLKVYQL